MTKSGPKAHEKKAKQKQPKRQKPENNHNTRAVLLLASSASYQHQLRNQDAAAVAFPGAGPVVGRANGSATNLRGQTNQWRQKADDSGPIKIMETTDYGIIANMVGNYQSADSMVPLIGDEKCRWARHGNVSGMLLQLSNETSGRIIHIHLRFSHTLTGMTTPYL